MTRTSCPSDLTDAQCAIIAPLIPVPMPGGRPRSLDMRKVINAILYVNRTGCAWRMLPKCFGNWSGVYHYFRTFREGGTWQRTHDKLLEQVRHKSGKLATPSAGVLHNQSVLTDAPYKTAATATTRVRKPLPASGL